MPRIRVEVDGEGKVLVKYEGFVGEMCQKEAMKVAVNLKALGVEAEVLEMKRTNEQVVESKEAIRHG